MGVTGNPDEIRRYGEILRRAPEAEPVLPEPVLFLSPASPLSAGLASAQDRTAIAATEFARAKDAGVVAAGDALVAIAANLADVDRRGADAIRQLLPEPAPEAGGAR
jgi:hypothetical protein